MSEEDNIKKSKAEDDWLKEEIPDPPIPANEMIPENTASLAPSTLNPQPSVMEVHHHGHVHEKRKWLEYLFQFLMLFLAVFLGFLAENKREHYVEHQREKQYVKSFFDDFKVDTATLQRTYDEKIWALAKLDSLQEILHSGNIVQNNELIYYFERFLTKKDVFTAQDVTYKQLLSSGNLRYFKNLDLYKKIAGYYNFYDRYHKLGEEVFTNAVELTEIESELFNATDLNSLYNENAFSFYTLFKRPDKKFHPVNANKQSLNFLQIKVGNAYYATKTSAWFLRILKKQATQIMTDFEKEYELK